MIVYIKTLEGKIYASPVFAEFGRYTEIKSVVLDETQENFVMLNRMNKGVFNFIYVDESLEEGWIEKKRDICGFAEILKNKKLLKDLKSGEHVSTDGFECVKKYKLPLEAKMIFPVESEKDFATFGSLCWGLHDAHMDSLIRQGNDIIIDFDTTWEKHIIMTFHEVIEEKGLDRFMFLYGSEFEFIEGGIMWISREFQRQDDDDGIEEVYVKAKKISYELVWYNCE